MKLLILLFIISVFGMLTISELQVAVHQQEQSEKEIEAYWSEERMRNAIPIETILPGYKPPSNSSTETSKLGWNIKDFPYNTAGKFFFHKDNINQDFVCSGSIVHNNRILSTAAHCVRDHETGAWYSKKMFALRYNDGYCNLFNSCIKLYPSVTTTKSSWVTHSSTYNWAVDYSFAALTSSANLNKLPCFIYNGNPVGSPIIRIGYPVKVAGGEYMITDNPTVEGCNDKTCWVGSIMGGGCSGGPWLIHHSSYGYCLRGINSYSNSGTGKAGSPVFNDETLQLLEYTYSKL